MSDIKNPKMDADTLANDFKSMHGDTLPKEVIDKVVDAIHNQPLSAAATSSYGANGSLASLVIYMKAQCNVDNGKTFDGDSWGIAFPGGGALFGDVYTDDIDGLYANTHSFAFTATPVYTAFYFFDKHSNPLGSFQAGSVSTVGGTGGGKGHWK